MAATIKTKSVSAVISGEHGAKPVKERKAEDWLRDTIVSHPEKSQNELLAECGKLFPEYGYSSFKIAVSRYSAVMREVSRVYNLSKKEIKK